MTKFWLRVAAFALGAVVVSFPFRYAGTVDAQVTQRTVVVSNGGTFVVQENGAALASLAAIELATEASSARLDDISNSLSADAVVADPVITTGPQIMGEAKDFDGSTPPNVVAEGEAQRPATTLGGSLWTFLTNETGIKELGKDEDTSHTSNDYGMPVWSKRTLAAAGSAGSDDEWQTLNTDTLGLLWSRQLDPCSGVAKTFHIVNMSTATTVEIANAVASQFFYICSVNLVAAAAQTIAIGEDDTDGCGSMTAGLAGGATAATGWSFAANGGIALGTGASTVLKTGTANRYLCVITGQAQQISGTISYVSAP
jgi:hypothetical protein